MSDSITCPKCKRTSYSEGDIKHAYCGHCHQYQSDMTTLAEHLRECAHESGEELQDCLTREHTVEHLGRKIEVYYNEGKCHWAAFVQGLGETTSPEQVQAGAWAKARIEHQPER